MPLPCPDLVGTANILSSMIQKIEIEVKKVKYVGFVNDKNAISANISKIGEG